MKTRGLPPPLTDSYFLSLSGCPDRGDKTQCLGQAAMLGEVVRRQLGEREWEAEGGEGGHRLASGSCPHHSPQHEGRWRMGNWATSGRRTVRAQAQVRPVPQQEARGPRRVVWGRTRLQERFTPGARAQASTVMDCRVAPVPLPRLPVRTTCCLIPEQLQAGPAPRQREPGVAAEPGQELSLF